MKRTATWMAVFAACALGLGAVSADTFEQTLTSEQSAVKAQAAGLKQQVSQHNAEAQTEEINFQRGGGRGHDHDGWRDRDHDGWRDHDRGRDRDHDGWRDHDRDDDRDHGDWRYRDHHWHDHDRGGWRGPSPDHRNWNRWPGHPGWGARYGRWGWGPNDWPIWWGWVGWRVGTDVACDVYYNNLRGECNMNCDSEYNYCADSCARFGDPYCESQCVTNSNYCHSECQLDYNRWYRCNP